MQGPHTNLCSSPTPSGGLGYMWPTCLSAPVAANPAELCGAHQEETPSCTCPQSPFAPGQQHELLDARTGRPTLSSQADNDQRKGCAAFACHDPSGMLFCGLLLMHGSTLKPKAACAPPDHQLAACCSPATVLLVGTCRHQAGRKTETAMWHASTNTHTFQCSRLQVSCYMGAKHGCRPSHRMAAPPAP